MREKTKLLKSHKIYAKNNRILYLRFQQNSVMIYRGNFNKIYDIGEKESIR
jgi:hypothetical protein